MKTSVPLVLVLVCSLLFLVTTPSHPGQRRSEAGLLGRGHTRLSLGIGAGGNGLALYASCSHSPIAAGGFGAVRVSTGGSLDTVEPAEVSGSDRLRGATEIGVLFGKEIERPEWHAHVAAGVGWTWGEKRTCINVNPYSGENEEFSTASIPIEVGFFFSPVLPVGLGLTGFGNLNSEKSFIGVLLCLELRRFDLS